MTAVRNIFVGAAVGGRPFCEGCLLRTAAATEGRPYNRNDCVLITRRVKQQRIGAEYTCILQRLPSESQFSLLQSLSRFTCTVSASCRCSDRTSRGMWKWRAACFSAAI